MNKKYLTFGILIVVLVGITVPSVVFGQDVIQTAVASAGPVGWLASFIAGGNSVFQQFAQGIGALLMLISSGILALTGVLFDGVIQFTILDMAQNIGNPNGVGGSITTAWSTLRDLANMCFIFVLLFAAFRAMFSLSPGSANRTILNIIIVALLINFSLFFSKVVIDASNVVSIGFYKSIITNNSANFQTTNAAGAQTNTSLSGISGGYMRLLGLQRWNSPEILNPKTSLQWQQILVVGIMSSIFMLVTAVIFLITAVMFVARFIILIFLMVLSPLAFIAFIIPGQDGQFKKWRDALIDQSFFAPIFFALTWVAFKIASTPNFLKEYTGNSTDYTKLVTESPTTSMALILNYVLVIGFSVAALIFAKQMASKTAGFSAISGGIISGAAFAGRQSVGRGSKWIADQKWLKDKASGTGIGAGFARAGLWTTTKGAKGSFDLRGIGDTKLSKAVGGGEIFKGVGSTTGKGGLAKAVEEKAKEKAKYAKEVYGQTPADKIRDDKEKERLEEIANKAKADDTSRIKTERRVKTDAARKAHSEKTASVKAYEKEKLGENFTNLEQLKKDKKEKERELQKARKDGADELTLESLRKESESLSKSIEHENATINEKKEDMKENDAEYKAHLEAAEEAKAELDDAKKEQKAKIKEEEYSDEVKAKIKEHKEFQLSGNKRQKAYAKRVGSGIFGWTAGNQAARREIEKQATEKTNKDKLAEAAKAIAKEDEETPPAATPTTPTTAPGGAPAS